MSLAARIDRMLLDASKIPTANAGCDTMLARVRRLIAKKPKSNVAPPPPTLLTSNTSDQELWGGSGQKYTQGVFELPEDAKFVGGLNLHPGANADQATLYFSESASTVFLVVSFDPKMARLESQLWDYRDSESGYDKRYETCRPWSPSNQRQLGLAAMPEFLIANTPHFLERDGPAAFLGLCQPTSEEELVGPLRQVSRKSLYDFVRDGRPVLLKSVFQCGVNAPMPTHVPGQHTPPVQDVQMANDILLYTLAHVIAHTAADALPKTAAGSKAPARHAIGTPPSVTPKALYKTARSSDFFPRINVFSMSQLFTGSYGVCTLSSSLAAGRLPAVLTVVENIFEDVDARLLKTVLSKRFPGDSPGIIEMLEFCGVNICKRQGILIIEVSTQIASCVAHMRLARSQSTGGCVNVMSNAAQRLVFLPDVVLVVVDVQCTQSIRVECPDGFPKRKLRLDPGYKSELVAQLANHSIIEIPAAPVVYLRDNDVDTIADRLKQHIDSTVKACVRQQLGTPESAAADDPSRKERRETRKRKSESIVEALERSAGLIE
jgi:hypothetical protein